jgi:iron complex outermembrane recepter protein
MSYQDFIMLHLRKALSLGVSALAMTALCAQAENAPETTPKTNADTLIVTAKADTDRIVQTVRQRLNRTPGAVSVVSQDAFTNSYAIGLYDTLKELAGVFAQKKFGEDGRLSIRGSGIGNAAHNRGTWLAIDGMPVNQADGSGDFQELDPLSVGYIEVYKGGNALRFGASQLGGVINYVTPTGKTAGYRTMWRLEGGSFGTVRGQVALAETLGYSDIFLSVTANHADGWRSNSESNAKRLTVNVGHSFDEQGSIRFIFQANDIDQGIAGGLTRQEALTTPKLTTAPNYTALSYGRDMKSVRSSVQTDWVLNENWRLEGGVSASWKRLLHPISIYIDQSYQNYSAFSRLDGQGRFLGKKADVFFGANYRIGLIEALSYANLNGNRGTLTGRAQQNAKALDIFAESRIFVTDELALIAGSGYGWTNRDYENRLNAANNSQKIFDWWAPRVGLLWENAKAQQVYANITRSVEAPTYGALVQTPIAKFTSVKPQEATTFEVGTRGQTEVLTWDITAYRATIDGEMLNFIISPDIPASTFNADKTIHQGLEAALDWRLTQAINFKQTYSWSDFRFDGDKTYGKARLPVVPEHYYRAELGFLTKGGLRFAPSVEWVMTDAYVDYANQAKSPGYAIANLSLSKRLNKTVDVFVDARNLTDERYISSVNAVTDFTKVAAASRKVFWPGEGQAFYFGIKVR